jgi:hypothetical protein
VFTRLRFRPTEFVLGALSVTGTGLIDVWHLGGTYFQTPTGRQPVRVAQLARRLQRGGQYFVAVSTLEGYPSLAGRYILTGGTDTLVRVDEDRAAVTDIDSAAWLASVIAQGKASTPIPGTIPSDAAAFLRTVRAAARAKR